METAVDNLDSFLEGETPETPEVEVPEVPETPETGEETPATPAEPPKEEETWTKAAYLAEKQKRQEAEQRATFLEQQIKGNQPQPEEEDPYAASIESRVEQKFSAALVNERINQSETFARDKYADYDEKLDKFIEMAQANPALTVMMRQQANPAEFAYKTVVNQQKLQEMQNPEEYERKLVAKIRAELEAENQKKVDDILKKGQIPGTLADARSVSKQVQAQWTGPPPLDDLLVNKDF